MKLHNKFQKDKHYINKFEKRWKKIREIEILKIQNYDFFLSHFLGTLHGLEYPDLQVIVVLLDKNKLLRRIKSNFTSNLQRNPTMAQMSMRVSFLKFYTKWSQMKGPQPIDVETPKNPFVFWPQNSPKKWLHLVSKHCCHWLNGRGRL